MVKHYFGIHHLCILSSITQDIGPLPGLSLAEFDRCSLGYLVNRMQLSLNKHEKTNTPIFQYFAIYVQS